MALAKFSDLNAKTSIDIPSNSKLTAIAGAGRFGRNLSINLQEMRAPGLPAGYKLCAYVESNRDCYIDTGIPSSDKVGFQLTYQYMGPVEGDPTWSSNRPGEVIIGAGNSNPNNTRQWINDSSTYSSNPNKGYLCVGWGENETHGASVKSTNNIIWGQVNFMMSNTAVVNNIHNAADIQLGYDAKFSGKTLYLFANNDEESGVDLFTKARLYRCRISVGRQIKRDFVPVRRESDGKYGLFESIEKKVYFPEQGNLTGLELSSLWDYSYFDGVEGAYIDDYPTPDSPNFVKVSGVEAGMAQIREALTVGPMVPTPPSTPENYVGRFVPFLDLLQKSTVPVPQSATDYPKNASGFIMVSNLHRGNSGLPGASWYEISNLFSGISYTLPLKYTAGPALVTKITLGKKETKYKSIYTVLGRFNSLNNGNCDAPVLAQNNCDAILHHVVASQHVHNGGFFTSVTNSSLRCLCPIGNSGANGMLRHRFGDAANFIQNVTYNFYLPHSTNPNYNARTVVFDGFDNAATKKHNKQKFYLPSLNTGSDVTGTSGLAGIFSNMPNSLASIVYTLSYIKRNISHTLTTGVDSQYFDITTVIEEVPQETTTGTTWDRTLTTATTKDSVVLIKTVVADDTTSTTGKLKTTTTYTLLPNDHGVFGEECRQLREALWNTKGIPHPTTGLPTSTGLLDGTIQVGANAGTAYANHWSLELCPVTHTWAD